MFLHVTKYQGNGGPKSIIAKFNKHDTKYQLMKKKEDLTTIRVEITSELRKMKKLVMLILSTRKLPFLCGLIKIMCSKTVQGPKVG